jgi:tripartite-type tricarboxylate transporter receptor subunit TctC
MSAMLDRRHLVALAAGAAAAAGFRPAGAQDAAGRAGFPSRPVRMVIPVGVGGVTDVVGRILADGMSAALGQAVVAENIPGAGSTVGAAAFHRAPADGHTILIATNNHPVMQKVYPGFPHDPVADFVPLALVGRQPFVLAVHPDVPARDVPELLDWLRRRGEAANYGATNPGATNHLAGELFKQLAGLSFTVVPYRTAANAVTDLVAGRMQLTIDSPTMLGPLMRDGQVRGLAVSSAAPSDLAPGLPSLGASGVAGYEMTAWQALYAKPGTPAAALAVLGEAARRSLRDQAVRERLLQVGVETWPDTSPDAADRHLRAEVERWAPIVGRINPAR